MKNEYLSAQQKALMVFNGAHFILTMLSLSNVLKVIILPLEPLYAIACLDLHLFQKWHTTILMHFQYETVPSVVVSHLHFREAGTLRTKTSQRLHISIF